MYGDEAYFQFSGYVNKQNVKFGEMRTQGQAWKNKCIHSGQRVTGWSGFWAGGVCTILYFTDKPQVIVK